MNPTLVAKNEAIYYWSPDNSRSEIDFLLEIGGQLVPIEVKAEENLKAKSLKVFYNKFKPRITVRASLSDFKKQDWIINLPLYAFGKWIQRIFEL